VLCSQSIFKQIVLTGTRLEALANKRLFGPMGLSSATLKILYTLSQHTSLAPTQLIQELGCTKSNITQRLNLLEKQDFIQRDHQVSGKDRRKVGVRLTEVGRRKLLDTMKAIHKNGSVLERHFSDIEKKACHNFMKKVNQILELYESNAPFPHC
jgi:DNA-binding MarR family transcriptional regulator